MPGICYKVLAGETCPYGSRCKFSHDTSAAAAQPRFQPVNDSYIAGAGITQYDGPQNVAEFFAEYPGFDYDPSNDCMTERRRLCEHLGLDPDNFNLFEVRETKRRLRKALVRQFNTVYGTDANRLQGWQDLCRAVDISPPDTLKECQEVIRGTHVNLVDLTEHLYASDAVRVFPTEVELSQYSKATEKIFPRDELEAGSLLRMLLRHIDHPRPEWQVRGTPPPSKARRGRRR